MTSKGCDSAPSSAKGSNQTRKTQLFRAVANVLGTNGTRAYLERPDLLGLLPVLTSSAAPRCLVKIEGVTFPREKHRVFAALRPFFSAKRYHEGIARDIETSRIKHVCGTRGAVERALENAFEIARVFFPVFSRGKRASRLFFSSRLRPLERFRASSRRIRLDP
jgi:hypothetical protein